VGKLNLAVAGDGAVSISGEITFFTVNDVLSVDIFAGCSDVKINFSGVTHSDSSGLALMVHWLRAAKEREVSLTFEAIPEKLKALAMVSSLDDVLPLA